MSFISELYHGNNQPQAKSFRAGSGAQRVMGTMNRREKLLTDKLEGEVKELFGEYAEAWSELCSAGEEDCFCTGFQLGAQCTCDIILGESEDYGNYSKG